MLADFLSFIILWYIFHTKKYTQRVSSNLISTFLCPQLCMRLYLLFCMYIGVYVNDTVFPVLNTRATLWTLERSVLENWIVDIS